jgi:tRNA threonylcarbamoyl adenosine modification protein (Sua5/YciO/YrdC/YwlC family)
MAAVLQITTARREAMIEQAVACLRAGGVVVLPTDTVYGLAAHPACPEGVARLYAIKGRLAAKPIPLLAANLTDVVAFGGLLSAQGQGLAQAFWPGALTLVLPCRGGRTEGFRVPAHDFTRALLAACGGLLRVTSANLSGAAAALTAAAAANTLGTLVDLVLDGGATPGEVPSTVVALDAGQAQILRHGAIPATRLLKACGGEG